MGNATKADWIAVDWGTTNLRAYAMQDATVLAQAASDDGMGKLAPEGFEPALLSLTKDWDLANLQIVACGMVGSRQGWTEAPYRSVPCTPMAQELTRAPTLRKDFTVSIVPGLSQQEPADVMRGEETQIAGFLSLNPSWDGVLCLPGTHTKWAHLSAGEVVSFQTFMTGEMFALLSEKSVLRHSVSTEGWDDCSFDEAVSAAISKPERLAARLFGLRAEGLLQNAQPGATRASLSGYLIGAELAAAKPYWLGQNVAILGTGAQSRAYQQSLGLQGVTAMLVDAERATLAGLTAAHRSLKEKT